MMNDQRSTRAREHDMNNRSLKASICESGRFPFSIQHSAFIIFLLLIASLGCNSKPNSDIKAPPDAVGVKPTARTVVPPSVRFTDITAKAGIDFVHTNGSFGMKLLPETMGGGVAFFDYD